MDKIKIFAPVDGTIKSIDKCIDKTFADKMLGDGFLVEPENNFIYSIFQESKIKMIFDTKHAVFLETISGLKAMIHIGIDTVRLEGKPFKYLKKVDDTFNYKEPLIDVDYKMIQKEKFSTETIVVFDNDDDMEFELTKTGYVKHGEEIGILTINKTKKNDDKLIVKESKFKVAAQKVYEAVGTVKNFQNCYNCMTRLRFSIIDKKLVNEDKLKKLPLVKGINWSGQELQIIIGGDVYKVNEEVQKIMNKETIFETKNNNKKKFKDRALGFISGVIVPTIPIILAAGLLMALKAILIQSNLIDDIKNYDQMKNAHLFSAFIYIIAEVGIGMLGIFLCISTVKYLKGNVIVGALIGVAVASPYLMWGVNFTLIEWSFIKIKLGGYYNSIIPQIVAGALYVYIDKWVKSWMPTSIDICFRTGIAFLIVMVSIMFVLGPILGVVEGLIGVAVKWLGNIPYGIGTMLFAMLWQPLVLTGTHVPVIMAIIQNLPSPLYAVSVFGVCGQLGAVIYVGNSTNNYKTKEIAYSSIPSAIVGITEPIIYGITLPRVTPFLTGCLGAAIGGLTTGLFGINATVAGGTGVLGVTRFLPGGAYQIGLFVLGSFISIGSAYLFTFLFFVEREKENKSINKVNKRFTKYLFKNNYISLEEKKELLKNLNNNLKFSKDEKHQFKDIEKVFKNNSHFEAKISQIKDEQNEKLVKLNEKIVALKSKNKLMSIKRVENIIVKTENNNKMIILTEKKEKLNELYLNSKNKLKTLQNTILEKINNIVESKIKYDKKIDLIKNNYYNAVHSLDIYFEINQRKDDTLSFQRKKVNNEIS